MGLTINENRMFSKDGDTPHTATRCGNHWEVSWLPRRELSQNEAVTAMTLAWQVAHDASMHGSRWPFIVTWAGELGLSGQQAVAMCTGEGERAGG